MQDQKMEDRQKCRAGKCGSGKWRTRSQGWKMQDCQMKDQMEEKAVEQALAEDLLYVWFVLIRICKTFYAQKLDKCLCIMKPAAWDHNVTAENCAHCCCWCLLKVDNDLPRLEVRRHAVREVAETQLGRVQLLSSVSSAHTKREMRGLRVERTGWRAGDTERVQHGMLSPLPTLAALAEWDQVVRHLRTLMPCSCHQRILDHGRTDFPREPRTEC